MCYLKFDKAQMTNLQDSLYKELLITNRSGAYCNTTLVGCNIRKYHGLMVVPVPELDDENHVLLSSLDETIVQHGAEFNLGLHKYQGENYSPKGHKYIVSFEWDKVPTWIYRIGGVMLKKEITFSSTEYRLYIRYTLLQAHSATTLRLKPFLAFRGVHQWTHENGAANTGYDVVKNGVRMCLYPGYPNLYMQTNVPSEFHYGPDWYRGLDYPKERERGYNVTEDLLVPGYLEMPITKEQPIVFSASVDELLPEDIAPGAEAVIEAHDSRDSFYHCLVNAAHQFNYQKDGGHYLWAGYPWFKCRARDTLMAMPGLTLSIGETDQYERYMDSAAVALRDLMNDRPVSVPIYEVDQPDVLLWAVWCLQQYRKYTSPEQFREKYGTLLTEIMEYITGGRHSNLQVHDNGLVYTNGREKAVTWMNSTVNGVPVTPRSGYIVGFNGLWYNALKFYEQILRETGGVVNETLARHYAEDAEQTAASFRRVFLNEHGYLFDYVDGDVTDWSVRPGQLFAIALDYSPLSLKERKGVLDICTKELVTPKGIRSLSPKSGGYNPMYIGPQVQRDYAYHQGTAWPWLTGFYLEAYLRVYKVSGVNYIERQLIGFEEELFYHCIGTIPELFDGNPRFSGRGAISFAMNVSGILRAIRLLERNKIEED
jgi:predicted glycogen debranching enzyme